MTNGDAFRFNGRCSCGAKFSTFATFCYEVRQGPAQVVFVGQGVERRGPGAARFFLGNDGLAYAPARNGDHAIEYACAGCCKVRYGRPVLGKFNAEKTCTAKCMASIGFQCECACGGKNHGASHGAAA